MILQASWSNPSRKILYAWKEFRSGSVLSPWAWLCLITLWVSQPSPDGPGKHQDGYRGPLAPGTPQGTAPTVIPEVRPGLPAGFPAMTLNSQLTGPQHPQHPRSAPAAPGGSWRNWSHFLEMLQSQALGTQPPTHRLAPPPVSTAFTHVAGSLSPSHDRQDICCPEELPVQLVPLELHSCQRSNEPEDSWREIQMLP